MNILTIIFQMLPILIFIIIDSIVNNIVISIISAIIFAVVQIIVTYYITKKIDYFIFIDAGLLIALGILSIVFNNAMFFKIKPAIVEGILVLFLFIMIVLPDSFINNYFSRFLGGMSINAKGNIKIKKFFLIFNIYTIIHVLAIIYTAYYSSKKIWAMVSGPGFYIIIIPVALFALIKRITMNFQKKKDQTVIIYDINDAANFDDNYFK